MLNLKNFLNTNVLGDFTVYGDGDKTSRLVYMGILLTSPILPKWITDTDVLIVDVKGLLDENNIDEFYESCINSKCSGAIFLLEKENEMITEISKKIEQNADFAAVISVSSVKSRLRINSILSMLQETQSQDAIIDSIVRSVLFYNSDYHIHDMIYFLKLQRVEVSDYFRVAVIHVQDVDADFREKIYLQIIRHFDAFFGEILLARWENYLVAILKDDVDDTRAIDKLKKIKTTMMHNYDGLDCKIALGNRYKGLDQARFSVGEAFRIFNMIDFINRDEMVYTYRMLGIYGILYEIENQKAFQKYINVIFDKLIDYDNKNKSNLLETLEKYIMMNLDLNETAKAMFLHKNTLRYRISRIQEILDCDLKDIEVITEIHTAFKIKRLLTVMDD